MTEQVPGSTPPGWHPDPWFSGQHRWYSGSEWMADTFGDASGPVMARGTYGPPPTGHAPTPPPPPEWGSAATPPPPPPVVAWPVTQETISSPPRSAKRWVIGAIAAAAVLALIAAVILRPQSNDSKTAQPTPTPSASTSPTPSTPSPSENSPQPTPTQTPSPSPSGSTPQTPVNPTDALLANLVVRQKDVPETYFVGPIPGGGEVDGQVTLDLCEGATYPSEALRAARLQVAALDVQSTLAALSTEAVRYKSADATAQAFDELKSTAASCSTDPVTDPTTGATSTTRITPDADASWDKTEGVDRLAYRIERTDSSGTTSSSVVVYLKRGPLFIGVYFPQPDGAQIPVEGKTTVPAIVKIFEERLLNPPTDAPDSGGSSGGGLSA